MTRDSSRSKRMPATFYWRFCVSGEHVQEAAAFVADKLTDDWPSPLARADVIAVLKATLRQAERGRLRPHRDCKPIRSNPVLYEIRWTDQVRLNCRDPVSGLFQDRNAHVRLYYAELEGRAWFLGLHGHEKVFGDTNQETRRLQDLEISAAARLYVQHAEKGWGVRELEGARSVDSGSDGI